MPETLNVGAQGGRRWDEAGSGEAADGGGVRRGGVWAVPLKSEIVDRPADAQLARVPNGAPIPRRWMLPGGLTLGVCAAAAARTKYFGRKSR
jgi:hypothetical protein